MSDKGPSLLSTWPGPQRGPFGEIDSFQHVCWVIVVMQTGGRNTGPVIIAVPYRRVDTETRRWPQNQQHRQRSPLLCPLHAHPRCAQVQRPSQRLSAWTHNHIVSLPHLCSYSLRPYTAGRSVRSLIPLWTGTSAGTVGKDACAGLLCISTENAGRRGAGASETSRD